MYKIHLGRYQPPPGPPPVLPPAVGEIDLPNPSDGGFTTKVAPPPGKAVTGRELALLRQIQDGFRTPAGNAWSHHMDFRGSTTLWLKPARDMRANLGFIKGWAGTGAMVAAQVAALPVGLLAERKHKRDRPYMVDPTLKPVAQYPPTSSYPSGHVRQAYASARVVARFDPSQADAAYGLARQVADSRLYSAAHYPSDVTAGAKLGVAVADKTMHALKRAPIAAALVGAALVADAHT